MSRKIITLMIVALILGLAGCALSQEKVQQSIRTDNASSIEAVTSDSAPRYFGEFMELYPNEYSSFVLGGMVKSDDGLIHSHAVSRAHTEIDPRLPDTGAGCISCKSEEFNGLYDNFGMELFSLSYNEISGEIADYWSCRTCHETGVPEEMTDATIVTYKKYPSKFLKEVDPNTAVCGQCHNATCTYPRYVLGREGGVLEDYDPYRYGTDADSMRKAAEEYGIKPIPDHEKGIDVFYLGHPDLELFQGSVHQDLGMTCVSCHMPDATAEDGSIYKNHDASGSPMNNEASIKYCLTCHQELGVQNTVEMRKYIRQKQTEMAALEEAYLNNLKDFWTLIEEIQITGRADMATVENAKIAYADAMYYYIFENAEARNPGQKVSHAPDAMRAYLEKGTELISEARASLEQ
jgi:nitrite reductase (cytochrome c-552)